MKTILYTLFAAALGVFLISSSGGRAAVGNQGNTGAPGDNSRTCVTCHGSSIAMSLSIEVQDESQQVVTEYIPGATYRVIVNLEGDAGRFGFQMTSLIDDTEEDVETWSDPSDDVQISSARGRQYVEHTRASANDVFEANWTAPADNVGSITFYAGGIGANGNGNTMGDGGVINTLTLTPMSTSTTDLPLEDMVEGRHSNPVVNELYYELSGNQAFNVSIVDQKGSVMGQWKDIKGEFASDLSNFRSGVYFVSFSNELGRYTEKVIKF